MIASSVQNIMEGDDSSGVQLAIIVSLCWYGKQRFWIRTKMYKGPNEHGTEIADFERKIEKKKKSKVE